MGMPRQPQPKEYIVSNYAQKQRRPQQIQKLPPMKEALPRRVETKGRFTFDSALCCEHDFSKVVSRKETQVTKTCTKCNAQAVFEGTKLVEYDATIGKNIKDIQ